MRGGAAAMSGAGESADERVEALGDEGSIGVCGASTRWRGLVIREICRRSVIELEHLQDARALGVAAWSGGARRG
jgi:hypothetical protein